MSTRIPTTSNVTWRPDVLAKTCELLRSGDIKQARGVLFRKGDGGQFDMCCLGVTTYATLGLGLAQGNIEKPEGDGSTCYFHFTNQYGEDKVAGVLPSNVCEAIIVGDQSLLNDRSNPVLMIDTNYLNSICDEPGDLDPLRDPMTKVTVAELNDRYRVSFTDIADIFEEAFR